MPHLAQTSSQASIDSSSALEEWISEGESDNDHEESDTETASMTSGSRSPATTTTSSLYEPFPHLKPVTHGVGHSTVPWESETFYGPFSQSDEYASYAEPSALSQELTQDVEMEDSDRRFDEEVMIYYRAATLASDYNQAFDFTPSTFDNSHVLPHDSIDFDPEGHVTNTEGFVEIFDELRA